MMTRGFLIALLVTACGSDPAEPPALVKVPGKLTKLAVNDTNIFAINGSDNTLIEISLDGTLFTPLPTNGAVSEVVAAGDWVAWLEAEGTGKVIRRRRAGVIESLRTFESHIVATPEGVYYSDLGIIGSWIGATPERIATPASGATLIAVDASFAYTVEASSSVSRYTRGADMSEMLLPSSMGATVGGGQLAYRTADGIRLRDLFTSFDRVVGAPPAAYTCDLLIAGSVVMCGKFRAEDGTLDALLRDPVGGYAANGKDLYWVTNDNAVAPISSIFKVDVSLP